MRLLTTVMAMRPASAGAGGEGAVMSDGGSCGVCALTRGGLALLEAAGDSRRCQLRAALEIVMGGGGDLRLCRSRRWGYAPVWLTTMVSPVLQSAMTTHSARRLRGQRRGS